jgi:uncharacterized protein YjbI with pentapeptide repeats
MVWEITPEELLERYASGERNFAGVELIPSDEKIYRSSCQIQGLEGANLKGINLRGAKLKDASFKRADLSNADLFGACLAWADLSKACLRNANISSASLLLANCESTNFGGAILSHVNAREASFQGAWINYIEYSILASANFKDALIPDYIICGQFNLIWKTVITDGTVIEGPFYEWKSFIGR